MRRKVNQFRDEPGGKYSIISSNGTVLLPYLAGIRYGVWHLLFVDLKI